MFALSTAASLILALRLHPPANIWNYLWAVLWEIPFLWVYKWEFGDESWEYAVAYCMLTAPILYAISRVALDSLKGRPYCLRAIAIAFIFALVLAKATKMDMHGQWAWISLCEGFLLLWMGVLTAFAGAWRKGWESVYVPLGMFWCAQGGFSFGWAIRSHLWDNWNWTFPPTLACIVFLVLAWRLRSTMAAA